MPQRYYGAKDLATIEKFNRELLGEPNIDDCGIIDQFVILYRVSVYDTETNMYGEASEGKVYKQGVKLPCIVDAEDFDFDYANQLQGVEKARHNKVKIAPFGFLGSGLLAAPFLLIGNIFDNIFGEISQNHVNFKIFHNLID